MLSHTLQERRRPWIAPVSLSWCMRERKMLLRVLERARRAFASWFWHPEAMGGAASWKADRESNPLFEFFFTWRFESQWSHVVRLDFLGNGGMQSGLFKVRCVSWFGKRRGIPLVAHTRENVRLSAEFLWLRASEYHTHIGALHSHAESEVRKQLINFAWSETKPRLIIHITDTCAGGKNCWKRSAVLKICININ